MKNSRPFWNWDLKSKMGVLTKKSHHLNSDIDELNYELFNLQIHCHAVTGIYDEDLLLFESYFDLTDDIS